MLFIVVLPVPAPRLSDVAPPPMFKAVTPEFSKLNVPDVEVMSPPFTAKSPAVVVLPFATLTLKFAPPTVRFAPVTSTPLVASTFPAIVTWPVELRLISPVPLVESVNPAVAMSVFASNVRLSLSCAKSNESFATETFPEETVKKLGSNEATPTVDVVAFDPVTVRVLPDWEVVIPFDPAIVWVPPKATADEPLSPAKVIELLASSLLATHPVQVISDAVIVPVPEKVSEDPVPTTIAAAVLVPLVRSAKEPEKELVPVATNTQVAPSQ